MKRYSIATVVIYLLVSACAAAYLIEFTNKLFSKSNDKINGNLRGAKQSRDKAANPERDTPYNQYDGCDRMRNAGVEQPIWSPPNTAFFIHC